VTLQFQTRPISEIILQIRVPFDVAKSAMCLCARVSRRYTHLCGGKDTRGPVKGIGKAWMPRESERVLFQTRMNHKSRKRGYFVIADCWLG
jgi:hypothetical protein